MTNMLRTLLYELDLFKSPFFFHLDGSKNKISTTFGSFFSLFIFGILFYKFCQSDMVLKTNPLVISQTQALLPRPNITLSSSNFQLYFGVFNKSGVSFPIDPSIFDVEVIQTRYLNNYQTLNSSRETIMQFINYKKCGYFINGYCINQSLEVSGYLDDNNTSFFLLRLKVCNNNTFENKCKTTQEITDFFSDKTFSVTYNDNNFNFNNYEDPIQSFWHTDFIFTDTKMVKSLKIFLKLAKLNDDDQFLMSNQKQNSTYMRDYIETDLTISNAMNLSGNIAEIYFFSSQNLLVNSRIYQKIDQVFANLSGVANFLIIIFFFFVKIEQSFNFKKHVILNLYDNDIIINSKSPAEESSQRNLFDKTKPPCSNVINFEISKTLQEINNQKINFIKIPPMNEKDTFILDNYSIDNLQKDMRKSTTNGNKVPHARQEKEKKNCIKQNQRTRDELKHPFKINIFQYLKLKIKEAFRIKLNEKELKFKAYEYEFFEITNLKFMFKFLKDSEKFLTFYFNEDQHKLFEILKTPLNNEFLRKFNYSPPNISKYYKDNLKKLSEHEKMEICRRLIGKLKEKEAKFKKDFKLLNLIVKN